MESALATPGSVASAPRPLASTGWSKPNIEAIYRRRIARLKALRRLDDEGLARIWAFYRDHPVEFINDWGVTYSPKDEADHPLIPFILFDRQVELVNFLKSCLDDREPGIVEKSRDTGASYVMAAFGVWAWLFRNLKVCYGSYDAVHVDVLGNMDSILEKVRGFIRTIPPEFYPPGFDPNEHMMHNRIVRPDSPATITGEVGKNIGRGGRATLYFVDEAAFLQHPDAADASLAATADVVIRASTAHGLGNFYEKVVSGLYRVFRLHWRDDPRRSEEWAKKKRQRLTAAKWAQEYEIDHGASIEGVLVPTEWVEASRALTKLVAAEIRAGKKWKGPEQHVSRTGGLDVGGGRAPSVFATRAGPWILPLERRQEGDTTGTAHWALACARRNHVSKINFDSVGIGAGVASTLKHTGVNYLDPSPPPVPRDADEIEALVNAAAARMRVENAKVDEVRGARISCFAINVGTSPSDKMWPDDKTSKEKFQNLRAEIYWILREAAERAFELYLYLTGQGGFNHALELTLLLPDDDVLAKQLSSITYFETPTGLIGLEKKADMAARGVPSPDSADAVSLTYVSQAVAEVGKITGMD